MYSLLSSWLVLSVLTTHVLVYELGASDEIAKTATASRLVLFFSLINAKQSLGGAFRTVVTIK